MARRMRHISGTCMYIYVYVCAYEYTCIYTDVYIYIAQWSFGSPDVPHLGYMYINIFYICTCAHKYMCIYIDLYLYIYVNMHIHMYLYTYIDRAKDI